MSKKDFIFVKSLKNKEEKKRLKELALVSQIALKYGGTKDSYLIDKHIYEFWKENSIPPRSYDLKANYSNHEIHLFIANRVFYDDPIWNNDFIQGVFKCAFKMKNRKSLANASFQWSSLPNLEKILDASPFGGDLYKRNLTKKSVECILKRTPALSLSYSEDSLSFMAGLMAGGSVCRHENCNAVRYPDRVQPYFEQWQIPFTKTFEQRHSIVVSPTWPALMTMYMPDVVKKDLLKLRKPWMYHVYPPFLWRFYIDSIFKRNGIPYLKTKRQVYYKLKREFPDERAMDVLKRFGKEEGLYSLDNRIGQTVVKWSKLATNEE